ncbi:unnamed protein product [Amoebophrya sp. A25]|nr:unnamed protein product [Amoebophrya sp. A25]|eukprot:GSA25T00011294001.1
MQHSCSGRRSKYLCENLLYEQERSVLAKPRIVQKNTERLPLTIFIIHFLILF